MNLNRITFNKLPYVKVMIVLLIVFFNVSSCSQAQQTNLNKKILIVYLSRTGNTKAIAEIIQRKIGGDLIPLELEKPYPVNYQQTVQQVADENEKGYLPALKTKIDSIGKYNVVFIGFPTWGMQLPPPIKSFLHEYDLSGKTVIPFNTNAGYGVGNSFKTVKQLCPNSTVTKGFEIKGGEERDGKLLVIEGSKQVDAEAKVSAWLQSLELIKSY